MLQCHSMVVSSFKSHGIPAGKGTTLSVHDAAPAQHSAIADRKSSGNGASTSRAKVTCDFTLLAACTWELRQRWLPAKVDQVQHLQL